MKQQDATYPFVVDIVNDALKQYGDKPRVLDIGCGPMQYESKLNAVYEGLDIHRHPNANRDPNYLASATEIPCPDATFDVIYSVACFCLIDPAQKAFEECTRVLKPGGTFILFEYQPKILQELDLKLPDVHHNIWDSKRLITQIKDAGMSSEAEDISWKIKLHAYKNKPNSPVNEAKKLLIDILKPSHDKWLVIKVQRPAL